MRNISDFGRHLPARLCGLAFTLILATISAQAYTIVLRSGRTVEIPEAFAVTKSAVIYEVASGIQVSIQLMSVDVAATEKLNNEGPGTFLRRIQTATPVVVAQGPTSPGPTAPARRSITNKDLERFSRARQQSELAYERRRKELGLPSVEESRQRAAAEAASLSERFAQDQLEEKSSEAYWRERAVTLKAEIAAADAEINSLRQQLDWLPAPNSLASVSVSTAGLPLLPLATFGSVNPTLRSPAVRSRVFVAPNRGPQMNGRTGGPVVGPARRNVFGPSFGFRGRRFNGFSPFPVFPATDAFGYQPYDLSYDRTALMTRLNELVAQRAGLQARWRALEEEARHAGALPGWLRP